MLPSSANVVVIGGGVRLDVTGTLKPCEAVGADTAPEDACPADFYRGPGDAENQKCGGDAVYYPPGAVDPVPVADAG